MVPIDLLSKSPTSKAPTKSLPNPQLIFYHTFLPLVQLVNQPSLHLKPPAYSPASNPTQNLTKHPVNYKKGGRYDD